MSKRNTITLPDRVSQEVDRVTEQDRLFFVKHPKRTHRVRLADPAEIAEMELVTGEAVFPAGHMHCIAVKRVADNQRMRRPFSIPDEMVTCAPHEFSEAFSRRVFEWLGDEAIGLR